MAERIALVKNGATHNIIMWDGDLTYKAAMEAQGFALVPEAEAPPPEQQTPPE